MNALVPARLPHPENALVDAAQWRVLTDAIWPAAKTAESVMLALEYCRARKLDPFKRPVHIVPMWNNALRREVETVWPGISELQTTAARTGQWAGMDPPEWGPMKRRRFEGTVGKRGEERQVRAEVEFPEWCSVTVYRFIGGQRCAFAEPVYWEEAYARQGRTDVPNEMWQKRVRGQLHKVAKAASLRAAFPEEGGNDYTAEEMEGRDIDAGGVTIEGQAEPHQHQPEPPPPPPQDNGKPRLTVVQFLDGIDRELEMAPDAGAVEALMNSQRVAEAKNFLKNGMAARLADWISKAQRRAAELRAAEAKRDDTAQDERAVDAALGMSGEVIPPGGGDVIPPGGGESDGWPGGDLVFPGERFAGA
jgi:phage recombination protein Bet